MTGFGRGVADHEGARATVELRAVNHRFLDLKVRASLAPSLEEAIGARVRAALERGAITVAVSISTAGGAERRIDEAAAIAAHAMLSTLAGKLGIDGPNLSTILAQPGVIAPAPGIDDAVVLAALDTALAELDRMRRTEGEALARDLAARFAELATLRTQLLALAATVGEQLRARLVDRLTKLAADTAIDPARITQEAALHADRAEITEELVRLASHLEQTSALLVGTAPAGRRLDFLVQEIGRELNTIGAKSALAEITRLIVESKAVLEKIREQVQNVE
ncbi:MAG: YicC family protein [Proteobacteria bacterium]|nr:YicC family protein [Pseudomonadota bacterium]